MKDHTRIEELYVARSLGELEPLDAEELARSVAAHGSDCPECTRLRDDYEEVAGRLAFALSPEAVPEGMVDRILEEDPHSKEAVRRSSFRRVAAALAAALLLGVGGLGGYVLASRTDPELVQAAEYLSEPGVRLSSLEGTGQGKLVLAFNPGREDSYLIGSDLEPAPEGDVYELWLIGESARPAGVFDAERGVMVLPVRSSLSGVSQVAVTLERAPGADQPTTDPIFAGAVTL